MSTIVLPVRLMHVWLATLAVLGLGQSSLAQQISQTEQWSYTFEKPTEGWQEPQFDDSNWQHGQGGFGTRGTPGSRVGTVWKSSDIWLRRVISIKQVPARPGFLIHHDDEAEIFLNGKQVAVLPAWTNDYQVVPLHDLHRSTLRQGKNTLAIHCHQDAGGQFIDAHIIDVEQPLTLPPASPFQSELITKWGSEVTADNAWADYPRPQMKRDEWVNLNGNWDYAITSEQQTAVPEEWEGKILVPFCLESKLGGVQRMLGDREALWYRRYFETSLTESKTLLNFEAVDYRCEVFVNGKSVGKHQGGNTPFSFDISDTLVEGRNSLVVRVEDETEEWQLRGKQVRNPNGIWYTQVSGIWQTIWLEQVPNNHIADLTIATDAATGTISIEPTIQDESRVATVKVVAKLEGTSVAEQQSKPGLISLTIGSARLWSPDSPTLYDLEVLLLDHNGEVMDRVESYAGIRTVGKDVDAEGHLRMTLNGKPIFHWGPLDQGWWPDGLLTPPSDEGMLYDIAWLKDAGFNMIRKHIKVEPRRYYYHCDRLGMMVWQDQVSAGHSPPWTFLQPNPKDADWSDENHSQFMLELERMIDALENHPSIVVWVPFNEAWGQHRTTDVGDWTLNRDPSRLVNIASGGNYWPVGDIADQHAYPNPSFPLNDSRFDNVIKVVGEFGGHGYPVEGHLWDADRDNWGYGGLPKSKSEYQDRYLKSLEILNELRHQGIAGGVYTQTTDVEGEINGLMSYDRKVEKISPKELKLMHQILFTP
ncbi:glycoside hydrolase family 2 protein [Rubripirellula amarantea]|nr:sugar-binding domain-containing protein [Rubripirellula amarantea]